MFCFTITVFRFTITVFCFALTVFRLTITTFCFTITVFRFTVTVFCFTLTVFYLTITMFCFTITVFCFTITMFCFTIQVFCFTIQVFCFTITMFCFTITMFCSTTRYIFRPERAINMLCMRLKIQKEGKIGFILDVVAGGRRYWFTLCKRWYLTAGIRSVTKPIYFLLLSMYLCKACWSRFLVQTCSML
jgi:hypothetical protein